MKKYIFNLFIITCCLVFVSCESETKFPDFVQVTVPMMKVDPGSDPIIEIPSEFNAKIIVDLYFPDKPESASLVVVKKGDYGNVKEYASIASFPDTIDISGSELEELFGEIIGGQIFEFGLKTVNKGYTHIPFNANGITYSADIVNLLAREGATPTVSFTAVCPIFIDDFVGTFLAIDEWNEEEYDVTISKVSETQLRVDGLHADGGVVSKNPLFIDIDSKTYTLSIPKQFIGESSWGYHNLYYSGTGNIDACDVILDCVLKITVDEGTLSGISLVLEKK